MALKKLLVDYLFQCTRNNSVWPVNLTKEQDWKTSHLKDGKVLNLQTIWSKQLFSLPTTLYILKTYQYQYQQNGISYSNTRSVTLCLSANCGMHLQLGQTACGKCHFPLGVSARRQVHYHVPRSTSKWMSETMKSIIQEQIDPLLCYKHAML